MKTERDFAKLCALFVGSILFGALLFSLISCGTLPPEKAKEVEDSIHWFSGFLPAPLGGIANSFAPVVATLLATKGAKHVTRHLAKRKSAKAPK